MQQANCVPDLAAGMKSLPGEHGSLADTQALWRDGQVCKFES